MTEAQVALRVVTQDAPRSTLDVVRSSGLPHARVIVVSNGSCDAADAEMRKSMRGATIVQVRPARGLSYAFNLGFRVPAEGKWAEQPEWTICANDDVRFEADWMAQLATVVKAKPSVLHVNMAYPKNTYSCCAIHRDLVRKIGWWDERFTGMCFEDDDWHLRMGEHAKYPHNTRVHENDRDSIFARINVALHDGEQHASRAKDRARFGFKGTLSKAANKAFFYKKWAVVEQDGWKGKGLPGLFARQLPEIEWHSRALLGGSL